MAKLFRFSGYFVNKKEKPFCLDVFKALLTSGILNYDPKGIFHQLHVDETEEFYSDLELECNCDLALLTRHFKKDTPTEYDRQLPQKGEKYRHFKIGKIVTVIGISRHTETEELSVVYEYEGHIWNRPLDMFMSEVDRDKYPDAEQKYRFEKVDE